MILGFKILMDIGSLWLGIIDYQLYLLYIIYIYIHINMTNGMSVIDHYDNSNK